MKEEGEVNHICWECRQLRRNWEVTHFYCAVCHRPNKLTKLMSDPADNGIVEVGN